MPVPVLYVVSLSVNTFIPQSIHFISLSLPIKNVILCPSNY